MYRLHAPAPALADLIESYWSVTAEDGPVDLRVDVFVDGRADLLFNFGAPYDRQVIGGATVSHAASNLDAQRMVPIRILQRGDVHIVGVRFRLGGVGPLATGPLRRWTGLTPPPEEVFGDEVIGLERDLRAATDLAAAARSLDGFFLARRTREPGRVVFERALACLVDSDGRATVQAAAEVAGVSGRQVDRLFERHLGLSPKAVARVQRFQAAMRGLMRAPDVLLADLAHEVGYFDQAHFIRDFRAMTGGVPRGYRGYYPPTAPSDFAPNLVVFVQDGPDGAPYAGPPA